MADAKQVTVTGGTKVGPFLKKLSEKMPSKSIKVGFLEGSTYPGGTINVPTVAMINEYGAQITIPAHETTVYRKTNASGTGFLRNGKFVKKKAANFSSTHAVGEHTVTIPPRPFFRNCITKNSPSWGDDAAKLLKADPDTNKVATKMGQLIKGQLQQSITDFDDPGNAPSTIAKKKFDKPLIDSGFMKSRVDYEVI